MQALGAHGRSRHRRRGVVVAVVVGLLVLASGAGAGAYFAFRHPSGATNGTGGGGGSSPAPTRPLAVVSTSPASGASGVASDTTISVRFSADLAASSATPTLNPPVLGSWSTQGDVETFSPQAPFVPGTTETLTLPAGAAGPRSSGGQLLGSALSVQFSIAPMDTLRLQQLLAELAYLPVDFTQSGPPPPPAQLAMDQPGTFAWRWNTFPSDLTELWTQGVPNVITKAAVMTFENQHGMTVDGIAGPQVWGALLQDAAASKLDQASWDYAYVNKNLPETLTLYVNGNPQYANILVNTGVPGADTADGTYAVFEHVQSSEMKGTNPDGTTYDDPNVPWASYFNGGDALHGFVRASYGFPQSNGCVEMPVATAGTLWPLTPIGTLVTVVGPPPS